MFPTGTLHKHTLKTPNEAQYKLWVRSMKFTWVFSFLDSITMVANARFHWLDFHRRMQICAHFCRAYPLLTERGRGKRSPWYCSLQCKSRAWRLPRRWCANLNWSNTMTNCPMCEHEIQSPCSWIMRREELGFFNHTCFCRFILWNIVRGWQSRIYIKFHALAYSIWKRLSSTDLSNATATATAPVSASELSKNLPKLHIGSISQFLGWLFYF